jgi:hypothetical protein
MKLQRIRLAACLSCLVAAPALLLARPAPAQNADPSKVKLGVSEVAKGISVIEGIEGFAGGNVGVSVGSDGVFIIDDELEMMSPKLQAELSKLSRSPVRFVINTHFHGDHAGGNAAFGSSGAVILAHDNVRVRAELKAWRDMLDTVRQRVQKLVKQGKTLEQAIAAKPTADLDAKVSPNFITPDGIVEAAYKSLTAAKSSAAKSSAAKSPAAKPPAAQPSAAQPAPPAAPKPAEPAAPKPKSP